MKKKDKIIFNSSLITVADGLVSVYDNTFNEGIPLLGIAWGLSKGMYGASIQLRQDRAIEFVEMIKDNSDIFTKEILNSEEFQDGFVYVFQKYLSERVAEKRKIIKGVFCGFAEDTNKKDFKLERILLTIEQLSIEEIEVLKIFYDGTIRKWHLEQFPDTKKEKLDKLEKDSLNLVQIGEHILVKMKKLDQYKNLDHTLEILLRLSNLGLLIGVTDITYYHAGSSFKQSDFGKEFTIFVKE